MKIGFHIYGTQLPPAAGTAGAAVDNAGTDVYRLVRDGMGCDFLLVGGGPAEAASDLGRASQLLVPWGAASLCVAAPGTEIVTRLNAWAFEPAHIARLGANLWELSSHRWALWLDSDPSFWPELAAGQTPQTNAVRTRETVGIVRQHWQGRAELAGAHLSSTGRMVGPRPTGGRPPLWLDGAATADGVKPEGLVYRWSEAAKAGEGGETLLTCAVVLGRSAGEAQAMAGECRALPPAECLVGGVETVGDALVAALRGRRIDRLAIGLPTLRAVECGLLRDRLIPLLRAALGPGGRP
ncbi:MAG: LLM class flavin-dependent oxidoreductase [Reyranellaceae bacterium]